MRLASIGVKDLTFVDAPLLRRMESESSPVSATDAPRSEESDLVSRLRLGDADAANEFFDRYAARVRRFIAQSLGADKSEADDLLQETFIALAEALPFFRGDSSLFTFACAIAHRKVLSFVRTNARRARLLRSAAITEVESRHDVGSHRDFNTSLMQLPPEYREALVLKYVEEISVAEIAHVLGVSEHAVESRLARARKLLRKRLGESQ
jgi:RNA polymerase sigma-70 factor, ECF subfamily